MFPTSKRKGWLEIFINQHLLRTYYISENMLGDKEEKMYIYTHREREYKRPEMPQFKSLSLLKTRELAS